MANLSNIIENYRTKLKRVYVAIITIILNRRFFLNLAHGLGRPTPRTIWLEFVSWCKKNMKHEFIQIKMVVGHKTINRNQIALIEDTISGGSQVTLNITDQNGKYIVIQSTDSQSDLVRLLNFE